MPRLRSIPMEQERMKRRTQESWAASQARVQRIWDGLPPEEGTKMQRLKENEQHEWPDPKPLPHGLAEVEPYSSEFLPAKLAKWVDDIANRLQCPPDYVAVAAIVALGSVIGRRVAIKPQQKTDWIEVPNLWGMFIGRPGMLKSPAMMEALKPLHFLQREAAKDNEIAQQAYDAGLDHFKLRKKVWEALQKQQIKKGKGSKANEEKKEEADSEGSEIDFELGEEPKEPLPVRYRTNDSSYEAIGEILIANPTGILIERDELVSLLKHLDRDDQTSARGFYLSGWSGTQPYTFDRIIRGHLHIDGVCISVLGNTQPARIASYVQRANADGGGGDGLLQRFSLMVWPDITESWKNVDEYPNAAAREAVRTLFTTLSRLTEQDVLKLGALKGTYDAIPYFQFSEEALAEFIAYRAELEARIRSGELSPALEGHIAKFRKLVPTLALINHLADNDLSKGHIGPVSQTALLKALSFAVYLESHARRVY